jgi:hypothetical protein
VSREFSVVRFALGKGVRLFSIVVVLSAMFAGGGCTGLTGNSSQLSANAQRVNFGSVNVGSPTSQLVTVTSKSATNVMISAAASGAGFSVSGASGLVLTPNQSVNLYVNFNPTAAGAVSGDLAVTSSVSPTPLKIALAGTGMSAQQQHSVVLQWSPSTSPVVGYFVYRSGGGAGSYAKLNASVDGSTSYTDSDVLGGSTYFYAVTALNSNNEESIYSNQVSVTIPNN